MSEEKAKLELQSVRCIRGERLLFSKLNFQCAAGTRVWQNLVNKKLSTL